MPYSEAESPGFRLLAPYAGRQEQKQEQQEQVAWRHPGKRQRLFFSPVLCTEHRKKTHIPATLMPDNDIYLIFYRKIYN